MARGFVIASNQFGTASGVPVTAFPYTVALWYYLTNLSPGADQHFITFGSTGGNSGKNNMIMGIINATGQPFGLTSDNTGSFDVVAQAGSTGANAWHSLVWSCASLTSRTLYHDGANPVSTTTSHTLANTNTNTWIGSYEGAASDVAGRLAEIAVANIAWNANEVAAYHRGVRPPLIRPGSLAAYWPLRGLASPEPDMSGNALNFTLTGSPAQADHAPVTLSTQQRPLFAPIGVSAGGGIALSRSVPMSSGIIMGGFVG